MDSITASSTKAEILSAACELTDHQAATIERLQQQAKVLWVALALALAWQVLF